LKSRTWFLIDALPNNEEMEKHIREVDKRIGAVDLSTNGAAKDVMTINFDLTSLAEHASELADAEYDKADRRFHVATTVSFFTYALGWTIALLRAWFGLARPEIE
jgi:hypothetical protein